MYKAPTYPLAMPATERWKRVHKAAEPLVVQTAAQFKIARDRIREADTLAVDTETDSLDFNRVCVGFSIAVDGDTGWYFPVGHKARVPVFNGDGKQIGDKPDPYVNLDKAACVSLLTEVLDKPGRPTWFHNAKFDIKVFRNMGIDVDFIKCVPLCTMVADWVIDTGRKHGLKGLVKELLEYQMPTFGEVAGDDKNSELVPIAVMAPYAVCDVCWLFPLRERLLKDMAEMGEATVKVWETLEVPTIRILERTEENGFAILPEVLDELYSRFLAVAVGQHQAIADLMGKAKDATKIGSTKWLSDTLIEELGWWPPLSAKGKNKAFSTAKKYALKWQSGIKGTTETGQQVAKHLLRYRGVTKLTSTYTKSMVKRMHPDGKLHASFLQHGTETGRLAVRNPSLQNIPIRTPEGRLVRGAFVASPGHKLLVADYSQVELRIIAHMSGDEAMLKVYQEDGDIHQMTADACGCSRTHAKGINFGLCYGMGEELLAESLGISYFEAKRYKAGYFKQYPGVRRFQERTKGFAKRHGYVTTLLGRRRYLPKIRDPNFKVRGHAERQSVNTKVQGSAADLIKLATRNFDRRIREAGHLYEVRMLSQVHDELIYEAKPELWDWAAATLKECMEQAVKLRVPLYTQPATGPSWLEAK